MQTVRQWLEQLGLPQYAELFATNAIDEDVLPDLTDDELREFGLPLGHRKKLLKAIAELNGAAISATTSQPAPDRIDVARALGAEAERRQLTVLFCDLVGSTALAERLDPEELRKLMQAYQRGCGDVVARYEGHVAQYLGDGLMVYFGWPQAHEDDAVRAIRAGLEMAQAVSQLKVAVPIRARIGVHTGLVVVGETGDGDASMPKAAVGETPNLAARVQWCQREFNNPHLWEQNFPHPLFHGGCVYVAGTSRELRQHAVPGAITWRGRHDQQRALGADPALVLARAARRVGDCTTTGSGSQDGALLGTAESVERL